jgi:hypothetical protein
MIRSLPLTVGVVLRGKRIMPDSSVEQFRVPSVTKSQEKTERLSQASDDARAAFAFHDESGRRVQSVHMLCNPDFDAV